MNTHVNLISYFIDELRKEGLISEIHYRNFKLKTYFDFLVSSGIKPIKARQKIAEEFFMSEKTVESIVYEIERTRT